MYNGIETFGAIVEHRARLRPNDRFIRFGNGEDLTYGEFHRKGNRIANLALSLGLKRGDTCAVMLPNSSEFLITWLGLARLGVMEVPINTGFRGDQLAYILNKAECQAIVISSQWVDRIDDISKQLTFLKQVIVVGDKPEEKSDQFSWYTFEQLISEASDRSVDIHIQASDPSLILFTSGTTGPSKGVVLTHSSNFSLAHTACELMEYQPKDRLFTVFPLFHVNARYTTILVALLVGCDVVMHNRFSASRFWDICRKENITAFNFMGSMLTILMKQKKRIDDADHLVRKAYGAPTPLEIYEDFQERFQVQISEVYGSTELGTVAANRASQFRKGACGRITPIYEVEIHDEFDQPCPVGKSGEIVVRPKKTGIMFSNYYGNSDATVKAWQNLWFHTGDTGRLDEDGYLYFIDRKKDVVRRRGENISSYEVERVINEHPQVLESAIIGVPSELSEEEVLAVVILKDGEKQLPEELLHFCQSRLAHFAVPRYIRYVKELPRNTSQRVEKYKLRSEGITSDTWDREQVGYQVKQ
ncbi:ATP-dependent acyl-CoA ligase [Alkalihalobacillus sp. MEB130]|uniref:ATP-dependent acyl-CoA ligase n=1 Tax=Alkalihalobacillus sp. MEB130 TaxID=2976704 RepID=UPI0028DE7201|nr:ATP-dependent acyl-CoA ligase [Alkalihalobacillus sp. MEB130]MDT8860254.1 ATP-dependent acyl-CoA ligase [Alkalihalobacillus sp. MEB130]